VKPRDTYSLIDLVAAFHEAIHGSNDPLSDEDYLDSVETFRDRLNNWHPSPPFTLRYDNAIRESVEAVLAEWEGELRVNEYLRRGIEDLLRRRKAEAALVREAG